MMGLALKRLIDIVVATVALVLCAPLLIAVATAILLTMGRPVLFRQERIGLGGRRFTILKFRSMTTDVEGRGTTGDGDRLTPLGRWLRDTSLDELPSLWNVLRGEMSLVGPRPLPNRYRFRYSPTQFRRHQVRPGLTGLAQVNGRNGLDWDEKFAYDVWYVEHRSVLLDLVILARTARAVLRREGITAPGSATAHEFLGSAQQAGCAAPAPLPVAAGEAAR
ncbi:sugar transferase [Micromonospora sp. NPDC050200]|uniref:sugar transferase n=1 Tax=Micromonospora sp. NPDC050200 TaxID=3155664 RepID=UPI00340792C6